MGIAEGRRSQAFDKLRAGSNAVPWGEDATFSGEKVGPSTGSRSAEGAGAGQTVVIGAVTFVLSTDEVDRHGDVVCSDGWRLEAYRENPVLLWAHDYRHPAIGRAASVWAEPHRLLAKIEFAPSAFAQEVASLYVAGFQWGVSVGFRPIRWEERRDSRSGAFLGVKYLEQELLEVSAVPVPANRSALRREGDVGGLEALLAELRAATVLLNAEFAESAE